MAVPPGVSDVELQNIRRIFQQFDADNSDSIDVHELKEVMASLGVLMEQEHLEELVEQVTVGGKQELNFDEFLSLITLWKEASQYKLFDGKGFKSLAQQHVEKALQTRCFQSDSGLRSFWDLIICATAFTYWLMVLLLDAYTYRVFNVAGLLAGDAILTVVLAIDVAICAQTCFLKDNILIDDPKVVFVQYAKTWMVPDILAALPLDMLFSLVGLNVVATVLRHCRLLKMLKLPLLWLSSGRVPITSRYIRFHFHALPLVQLVLVFMCMVHGFAVGWVLIKQGKCTDSLIYGDCTYPYAQSIYFVMYSLSTVGLGDVSVNGDDERWYATLILCGAMATNGIVIAKLVAILQRADIKKERRAKLRETLAVLDHFAIPKQLQEEILQFQAHVFEHNLGAAYEGIVSGLPAEMRVNISLFVKMKLVTNVPLFLKSHYMLRIAVAQSLENAVARPEQYIVVCGQECDGLYFLAYGFADVFDEEGTFQGTLRSSDFFGEAALLGQTQQTVSAKAITYCDLWVLSRVQFEGILKRFPKFKRFVDSLSPPSAQDVRLNDNGLVAHNPGTAVQSVPTTPDENEVEAVKEVLASVNQHTQRIADLKQQIRDLLPTT